jgi:carbonic anhydrase/acetyltransferase-like protein (isoleucine patch superfamily)
MATDTARRYRPSSVIRTLNGRDPTIGDGAFVDETAVVIGTVRLGAHASVWPTAVIRGDTDLIAVGERSNVQDGAVLHADEGVPCRVGAGVTVGHRAVVHGCTIEDDVLVGMGAIVMNRALVGAGSIVGAGAVVPEGAVVPPGSMALGVPARVVRATTDAEREGIRRSAAHYVGMIARHRGA